MGNFTV